MFNTPDLKPAFAGRGHKAPELEKALGIVDKFRAASVTLHGPEICRQLRDAKKSMIEAHSLNGTARDVRTHFALQAINNRVESLTTGIQAGGPEGYEAMQNARKYLDRLQKLGLDA